MRRQIGQRAFTIIELIVVVAIAAVVLSLAAPSFKDMIDMQRLRGTHDQLVTDLQFARSEAARLGIPVNMHVQPGNSTVGACYTIFSDTTLLKQSWTAPCDCRAAPGSRCSTAVTSEIKTVQLNPAHRIQFQHGPADARVGYSPITGGIIVETSDKRIIDPVPFIVSSHLDTARTLRTIVELSGRPSTCAPTGSNIRLPAC